MYAIISKFHFALESMLRFCYCSQRIHASLSLHSPATVLLFYVAAFGIFLGRTYFLEVFSVHFRLAQTFASFRRRRRRLSFFCLVFVSHLIMEILAAKRVFA